MPNWCDNAMFIDGPKEKLAEIADAAQSGKLLSYLNPEPEDYSKIEVKNVFNPHDTEVRKDDAWYHWRLAEWGTKWEIDSPEVADIGEDTHLAIYFLSAWSPPLAAIHHFLERNKDVWIRILYYEPGCSFCGDFTRDDNYFHNIEEDDKNIPDDIVEQFRIGEDDDEV